MAPAGVRYLSSGIDVDFQRCFQLMETESEAQLQEWSRHWDDLVDFEFVPVRTSQEAAAVMAQQS